MKTGKITLALILSMAVSQAMATPRSLAGMRQAAVRVLEGDGQGMRAPARDRKLTTFSSTDSYMIMGYEDGGFAVISTDDLVPEVLGYSRSAYSESDNPSFRWWLKSVESAVKNAVSARIPLSASAPDTDSFPPDVAPMMNTRWGQETPYNNMCPRYSDYSLCVTGCIATAMAQILYYHKQPVHGIGTRTIYYPQNRKDGQAVTADFENDYYDWDSMLEQYVKGHYTQKQADAVALLMRDCGVASNMEYSGTIIGSGAFVSDAAFGLRNYLNFPDAHEYDRKDYTESEWMDMIYSHLAENGPILYTGGSKSGGGHAFVLHGYNQDGLVYVNWGWDGEHDGYYDISILDPHGDNDGYTTSQNMICGIKSNLNNNYTIQNLELTGEGTLKEVFESLEDYDMVGSLTIKGPMNRDDLLYLSQLAGGTIAGNNGEGQLRWINMQHASLSGNTLPDSIFMGCSKILRVVLPESLERIGREAFSGCSRLSELRVLTATVPSLGGQKVFEGLPMENVKVYVRRGMKSQYLRAAQWKNFGSAVLVETGTNIKVQNVNRNYGDENPVFTYTLSGDSINGIPEISCEATSTSPAGRYIIKVSPGTIGNDGVYYTDGYLNVLKINATATVGSYTRNEGEPNPEFRITGYEGLISADTVPVWLSEPVIVTDATEQSPPGEYPITVQSASAQSYNITFIPGTLTVNPSTGVPLIGRNDNIPAVITIDGKIVPHTPMRGLQVIDGKKRFVR